MPKKRKLNSKNPKYLDKNLLNKQIIKKKVHSCTNDLYFEEMDKWKSKYDQNDYEAYQIYTTQTRLS